MTWVDLVILLLVAAAVYAEVKRGLLFAAVDVVRIIVGVLLATGAYALVRNWTRDYTAGAIAFFVAGLAAASLLDWLAKKVLVDSPVSQKPFGRVGAGIIGLGLGWAICLFVVPVLANIPGTQTAVQNSLLARPFLRSLPAFAMVTDQTGLDLPQLSRRPLRYEDEGTTVTGELAPRVRFSRLEGATCIACRGRVKFLGYFLTQGGRVSPKFRCESCGRTSDGCQTFEGFHAMYGLCPVEVAIEDQAELDCGVWPNEKAVLPTGACPVCGLEGPW